jgi:hypothetical protein
VIGEHLGFTVAEEDSIVAAAVAYELEHRMERLVRGRMLKQFGHSGLLSRRRAGTGITVLDLRPHETERLLRWSMAAAERKNARRRAKGEPELTEYSHGLAVRIRPSTCLGVADVEVHAVASSGRPATSASPSRRSNTRTGMACSALATGTAICASTPTCT